MKSVIITGANAGIGLAAAKFIAAHPEWHVILACRRRRESRCASRDIWQSNRDANVSFAPLPPGNPRLINSQFAKDRCSERRSAIIGS
jgi:NAD(P)-dependent dehydrogenase (short-subunit alcohol dehydrogenase family)